MRGNWDWDIIPEGRVEWIGFSGGGFSGGGFGGGSRHLSWLRDQCNARDNPNGMNNSEARLPINTCMPFVEFRIA